jgi:hypothetical protein
VYISCGREQWRLTFIVWRAIPASDGQRLLAGTPTGTKTDDWLGERAILAGRDKDVEERNNIIQSVTGKGHSNAWPGTASRILKVVVTDPLLKSIRLTIDFNNGSVTATFSTLCLIRLMMA